MNNTNFDLIEVGKLKKNSLFCLETNGIKYKVTRSGFGTGKYVDVRFVRADKNDDQSTYNLSKKTVVIKVKN